MLKSLFWVQCIAFCYHVVPSQFLSQPQNASCKRSALRTSKIKDHKNRIKLYTFEWQYSLGKVRVPRYSQSKGVVACQIPQQRCLIDWVYLHAELVSSVLRSQMFRKSPKLGVTRKTTLQTEAVCRRLKLKRKKKKKIQLKRYTSQLSVAERATLTFWSKRQEHK